MKRVCVSLGVGLAIPASLIMVAVVLRGFREEWLTTAIIWMFIWPFPLFRCLPVGHSSIALITFVFGAIMDVGILFWLTYGGLGLLKRRLERRRHSQRIPPPPPPFSKQSA